MCAPTEVVPREAAEATATNAWQLAEARNADTIAGLEDENRKLRTKNATLKSERDDARACADYWRDEFDTLVECYAVLRAEAEAAQRVIAMLDNAPSEGGQL